MIIGKGSIADRFIAYSQSERFIIITGDQTLAGKDRSSQEVEQVEKLLHKRSDAFFVFFSNTDISAPVQGQPEHLPNTVKIEEAIKSSAKRYLIIRLPVVIGHCPTDKTLLDDIVASTMTQRSIEIVHASSVNLIDVDDVFFITDAILEEKKCSNQTINIANTKNITLPHLVAEVEAFFQKKATITCITKKRDYTIDLGPVQSVLFDLGINFSSDYYQRLLRKYYKHAKGGTKKISVVVPTYYAEKCLHEFYNRTKTVLELLKPNFSYEIIFVNDGSRDNTLPILIELAEKDPAIKAVNFSRNFGNQPAITAGIDRADCDVLIIIDDDLQDPPEVILSLLALWENGFDVVYGVRRKRKAIGALFSFTAKMYYRLIDYLSEITIPLDTGDFRLIDRKALGYLKSMKEENRYFRGMVAWIGFKQVGYHYNRDARYAGESNFTLTKYLKFAFAGLTSFSEKPLYFSSFMGFFITILSLIFGLSIIYLRFTDPSFSVRGWPSLATILLFFGGIQLLSVGVIGLYIGKIYRELKGRPLYIVESEYGFTATKKNDSD